jgi:hypothetical protein
MQMQSATQRSEATLATLKQYPQARQPALPRYIALVREKQAEPPEHTDNPSPHAGRGRAQQAAQARSHGGQRYTVQGSSAMQ